MIDDQLEENLQTYAGPVTDQFHGAGPSIPAAVAAGHVASGPPSTDGRFGGGPCQIMVAPAHSKQQHKPAMQLPYV